MSIIQTLTPGAIVLTLVLTACDGTPKTIPVDEPTNTDKGSGTGVFTEGAGGSDRTGMDPATEKDLHTVVALDALPIMLYV